MPQLDPPDPQLVQRIRELVARAEDPRHAAGDRPEPGWVPPAPTGFATPRVVTLPGVLRSARLRVDRRAVHGMVVVLLAAALVFAVRVAVASGQGQPVVVAANPSGRAIGTPFPGVSAPSAAPRASALPSASPAGGGEPSTVHVHVVGQVAKPGVVTLVAGSRVADALAGAGGALPSADLSRVNLARLVSDGEQVSVPAPEEPGSAESPPGTGLAGAASASTTGLLVDLNTADLATLDTLPGVGPVLAQRIVDWRQEQGRFSTVEELGEVTGIGDKLLAQLRPKVTLGGGPRR